jgi:ADP-ribosyl-[dinitrogen reductase] hydrolase
MSSAALLITTIDLPGGGHLGLTHCPGRCGGAYGQRHLDDDLAAIEAWGADLLISLVEAREFARLGVPTFVDSVQRRSFRWHHVPIPDFGVPSPATLTAWDSIRGDVRALIDQRGRIGLHCAAGLGRTGTIAAKILSECGLSADDAIARVRDLRPGTIETAQQLAFVHDGARLL